MRGHESNDFVSFRFVNVDKVYTQLNNNTVLLNIQIRYLSKRIPDLHRIDQI